MHRRSFLWYCSKRRGMWAPLNLKLGVRWAGPVRKFTTAKFCSILQSITENFTFVARLTFDRPTLRQVARGEVSTEFFSGLDTTAKKGMRCMRSARSQPHAIDDYFTSIQVPPRQ